MTIMTAKAYYDEARRKIEEGPGPMSENSGWFLKKRAKNLSRLGMDDAKPGAENPVCETKGFAGMRWATTNWETIETATSSKLREQVRILREALEASKSRMEIAAEYLHRFQGACAYHGDQLVGAIKRIDAALEATKEKT